MCVFLLGRKQEQHSRHSTARKPNTPGAIRLPVCLPELWKRGGEAKSSSRLDPQAHPLVFSRGTIPVRKTFLGLAGEPSRNVNKRVRAKDQEPWFLRVRRPEFGVKSALNTVNTSFPPVHQWLFEKVIVQTSASMIVWTCIKKINAFNKKGTYKYQSKRSLMSQNVNGHQNWTEFQKKRSNKNATVWKAFTWSRNQN